MEIKKEIVQNKQNINKPSVIPKPLIPTKKTASILSFIFLAIIILGIFQFPLSSLLSGKTDIAIKIGWPLTFLKFDLEDSDEFPLKFFGLIFDLILCLIIAYAIDVAINTFSEIYFSGKNTKNKEIKLSNPQKIVRQPSAPSPNL